MYRRINIWIIHIYIRYYDINIFFEGGIIVIILYYIIYKKGRDAHSDIPICPYLLLVKNILRYYEPIFNRSLVIP